MKKKVEKLNFTYNKGCGKTIKQLRELGRKIDGTVHMTVEASKLRMFTHKAYKNNICYRAKVKSGPFCLF